MNALQPDTIWTVAAWLGFSVLLLLTALHLALTGRRFEVHASVRHGRRRASPVSAESALALIACLVFGVVLFSVSHGQSMVLRLAFAIAGATVLCTGAWWLFSWLRDASEVQTESNRVWRRRALKTGVRIRSAMDPGALRGELCRAAAENLDASMVEVIGREDRADWICLASLLTARIGVTPSYPDMSLSTLDPLRSHVSRDNGGVHLFPLPVTAESVEWLAVTLPYDAPLRPETRTYLEICALQAGIALHSVEAARAYSLEQAELLAAEREQLLWRRAMGRLVPPDLPDIAGLEYGAEYWRGQAPQGQFIDLISLPQGALGIVLAEVESTGMEAAVQIAQLQVLLRSRFQAYAEDLAELLQSTERALLSSSEKPSPVRLFCGRYSPQSRTLAYVNAGAVPPLMVRREPDGAQVLRLPESSTPMAIEPPTGFRVAEVTLRPGDLVAIPSLSLLFNPSADPNEPMSDSRLADALIDWEGRKASDLVRLVFRTIEESGPAPATDRAMILLKAL
ncbi:MAG: hypothetical protein C0504_02575 [Candidatus Solibacter sp.]|nr:hypothetical protein [Candidatus Solibacter sp.]